MIMNERRVTNLTMVFSIVMLYWLDTYLVQDSGLRLVNDLNVSNGLEFDTLGCAFGLTQSSLIFFVQLELDLVRRIQRDKFSPVFLSRHFYSKINYEV